MPSSPKPPLGNALETQVFGNDYPTRDGSCVRDYIHVMDLANAHTKALEYLLADKNEESCDVINLGSGEGVTVFEAINAFETATGQKLNYRISRAALAMWLPFMRIPRKSSPVAWLETRTRYGGDYEVGLGLGTGAGMKTLNQTSGFQF